jgi:DNA-binding Xre family transcriptional regulator
MSERSLQVHSSRIETVKEAFKTSGRGNQIEFARAVGFSDDTLRAFLHGKPVDRETFMRFCEALELNHEDLIQEPSASNSTSGTQINQSAEINNGFMIGTIGTFNQK